MNQPKDTPPVAPPSPSERGDKEDVPGTGTSASAASTSLEDDSWGDDEPEDAPPQHLEPGSRVGRYMVLECVGEGSMGQVYAAYDPELDRKVALKILRMGGSGGTTQSRVTTRTGTVTSSRRRLMREAKALSQLAHPNVVAIHDVGTLDDEVFVAMEFVAGTDLRQWSLEKQRTWQEVLEVYIQAGQGLAAAHAAGLVHRDFKPQNAVLGADGRVRVLDFGLATPRASARGADKSLMDVPLRKSGKDSGDWASMTFTRARLGTPGYMAPEVIAGGSANDKSDQFSFCVSLFQALHGCRPFAGQTLTEIGESINAGHIVEVHQHAVPGWVRKAVLRGLSADVGKRHPSMEALLTVLQRRDPASRRTRYLVRASLATAVTLTLAVGINHLATRNASLCQGAQRHLVDVWDGERAEAVRKALMATGVSYAPDTWSRVNINLDAYTHAWVTMHQDACEATHVRGEQSGELLDLRMRCLKERLGEVKALVDVLSRADADVVQKAVPASNALMPVSTCADEAVVRSTVPLPRDATTGQQVEAVRQRLEYARALERTGKYADGLQEVQRLEIQTRALGYAPLLAELLLLKGMLLTGSGKYQDAVVALEEADLASSDAQHTVVTAMVQRELVMLVGSHLMRFEEGLVRARYARVILQQTGLFGKLGAGLLNAVGSVFARKGEPEKAVEQQQRALELCTRAMGEDKCCNIVLALGTAHYLAGRLEAGERYYREAISIMEKTLGATHPSLGRAMNNYGVLLSTVGKYDDSMEWLQRARSVYEQSVGKEHPISLDNSNNVGNVYWWKGEYQEAIRNHSDTLERRIKVLGPTHYAVATSHQNLGTVYLDVGKLDLARQHMERCLEILIPTVGTTHERTLGCQVTLGSILAAQGRFDQAEPLIEKSLEQYTKALGPEHPALYEPLSELANVMLARRDPSKAAALLERSLEIQERKQIVNKLTVVAHLRLAKALWEIPERRAQAVPHAQQASDILTRLNVNIPSLAGEIARWLETHKH